MTNPNVGERWRIWRRPPDTSIGESSYSTAIYKNNDYPIVGYGFTPEQADAKVIEKLLSAQLDEVERKATKIIFGEEYISRPAKLHGMSAKECYNMAVRDVIAILQSKRGK